MGGRAKQNPPVELGFRPPGAELPKSLFVKEGFQGVADAEPQTPAAFRCTITANLCRGALHLLMTL